MQAIPTPTRVHAMSNCEQESIIRKMEWDAQETAAEAMIPLIGDLYRDKSVETSLFGQLMVKRTVSDIMVAHELVREVQDNALSPVDSLSFVKLLHTLPIRSAHIDVGKLLVKYRDQNETAVPEDFLQRELAPVWLSEGEESKFARQKKDVVLYGFGRIGRLLARLLCDRTGGGRGTRLRAIVVRRGGDDDLQKRASLLRQDSVHGPFNGVVRVDEINSALIINNQVVQMIYSDSPESVDYESYGINNAVLVDNTGKWRDEQGLGLHLKAGGISQVLLTAPGKGDVKNIVHGINHGSIDEHDTILSAASCTTNAIAPVIKAVNDKFGIVNGHMETIHSYTNDQNLIDNYHKGDRRGRSAVLNMVLTETGAAKAVAKALPEMAGKLTGSSVRVPTPNVSLAVLNLNLERSVHKEELNELLRYTAFHSDLQKQVGYTNSRDAVSTDFVGARSPGVVDAQATIAEDNRCVLYIWYDNEFGYTVQVVRILRELTHSTLPAYPR
jgi:glyceraldehyde 3-phosphate dehydrogenase